MTVPTIPEVTNRERLINCAAYLFAKRGFDSVSVRDISNEAQVNSALIRYYFGNKEGLLAEVYTHYCTPLKNERARLLAKVHQAESPAKLEEVLEAFIRPSLAVSQSSEDGQNFSRLRTILAAENSSLLEELIARNFDESSRAYLDVLAQLLPELERNDIYWRFHFLLGCIQYTAAGPHRMKTLSGGTCNPADLEATTQELIRFASAGFRMPSSQQAKPRASKSLGLLSTTSASPVQKGPQSKQPLPGAPAKTASTAGTRTPAAASRPRPSGGKTGTRAVASRPAKVKPLAARLKASFPLTLG